MFKGCCFGSGGRGLKDSPELSDKRRLKSQDVVKGGSKDTSNGATTREGGCGEESLEPTKEDKVVDSQIVGTLQGCSAETTSFTSTTANVTRVAVAGVNSSAQLPKDKEDSNGISSFIPLKLQSILVKFN